VQTELTGQQPSLYLQHHHPCCPKELQVKKICEGTDAQDVDVSTIKVLGSSLLEQMQSFRDSLLETFITYLIKKEKVHDQQDSID